MQSISTLLVIAISTHSRAKAAGFNEFGIIDDWFVSTHSRAKAAGAHPTSAYTSAYSFNSQPREGGWFSKYRCVLLMFFVSTHSRAKAAGIKVYPARYYESGFNSQPREGGWGW